MVVKVHSYYYASQGIGLEELHLSDMSCHGVQDLTSPDIWIFNTTTLSSCSTSVRENSTHFLYSNTINNVRGDGVYHGDPFYSTFSCVYEKEADVSLVSFNYGVIKNVKNITAPNGLGVFSAEMNLYTDDTHTTPNRRTQFEPTDTLYVMIKLEGRHPDLALVIHKCWITAAPVLSHESQYVFIEDGCPVTESGNDVQITASGVGQRASFQSPVFGFIDYDTTYLHCLLEICSLSEGNECEPLCNLAKRSFSGIMKREKRQSYLDEGIFDTETLSVGPYLIMRDEKNNEPGGDMTTDLSGATLIAVLVTVMIVVVGLLMFAGIWIRRKRNTVTAVKLDVIIANNPAKTIV